MNAGDILTLAGDIAAAAAAVFGYLALGKANDAVKEAKAQTLATEEAAREAAQVAKDAAEDRRAQNAETEAARQEALEAAKEASADRMAADEDRELERDPRRWWPLRDKLGQAMVGLGGRLPKCAELVNPRPRAEGPFRTPAPVYFPHVYAEATASA